MCAQFWSVFRAATERIEPHLTTSEWQAGQADSHAYDRHGASSLRLSLNQARELFMPALRIMQLEMFFWPVMQG